MSYDMMEVKLINGKLGYAVANSCMVDPLNEGAGMQGASPYDRIPCDAVYLTSFSGQDNVYFDVASGDIKIKIWDEDGLELHPEVLNTAEEWRILRPVQEELQGLFQQHEPPTLGEILCAVEKTHKMFDFYHKEVENE